MAAETAPINGANSALENGDRQDASGFKLKFCTVCASNQNRYDYPFALHLALTCPKSV